MLEYNTFSSFRSRCSKDHLKAEEKKMQEKFNIDDIVKELDAEFELDTEEVSEEDSLEAQDEQTVEEDTEDTEALEEDAEEVEEDEEVDEKEAEEEDEELHRRNEAFKRLREERDQYAETDQFLEGLAAEYGMTKQQLIDRWKDETAQRRAKKEGVSPEAFKRQQELERKVQELEIEKKKEIFNIRTQAIVDRYNLSESQVDEMFAQASEMGIEITQNPELLEFVYKAMNYDTAIEQGRQKQLEISKKRSKTSAGRTGTKGAQVNADDGWEKEIDSILREQNLIK
jgi:hypothetical protein